jgi:lipocalin-like protein
MTRRLMALVVTLIVVAHSWPLVAQHTRVTRGELLGAWRLSRVEIIRADGEIYLPFGEHVTGILAYVESGDVVVAWGRADRPEFAKSSNPTGAELLGAVEDYFNAYFGTFEFEAAGQQVRHRTTGGLRPGGAGRTLVRDVELRGDTLVLTQPAAPCSAHDAGKCQEGEQVRMRLFWSRSR